MYSVFRRERFEFLLSRKHMVGAIFFILVAPPPRGGKGSLLWYWLYQAGSLGIWFDMKGIPGIARHKRGRSMQGSREKIQYITGFMAPGP